MTAEADVEPTATDRAAAGSAGWMVAGAVVIVALSLPNRVSGLAPRAFLSIPVEGLLGVCVLLIMPARVRGVAAAVLGFVLGGLTVLKIVDMGFYEARVRPFDPLLDWSLFGSAMDFLGGSVGRAGAVGAAVAAVVVALGLLVVVTVSVLRLGRALTRNPASATWIAAVLTVVWVTAASLGVQVVPGVPLASDGTARLVSDRVDTVRSGLQDRQTFSELAADDAFADTPGAELLPGLKGKDVVVAFVESYGRDAVEDPELATGVDSVLDTGTRRLEAAGFASRSAFLTSSTAGGGSWLAHSSLLSGLWIDDQQRYRGLLASDRLTLTGAFRRAGWRTVGVMPGVTTAWPDGAFFGYDQVYDSHQLGYRGPNFSWATMPDQYTLAAFERLERGSQDRLPIMAVMPLVSSHAPWSPTPRMISWSDIGDGSSYDTMAEPGYPPEVIGTRDPARVRADYRRSIEYSLASLVSYLQTHGDDELVLIFLGDHQPTPIVTGPDATRDVPITIVARYAAVLAKISGWHWQDGMNPGPQAPVWRMDTFRDRFLTAYGR